MTTTQIMLSSGAKPMSKMVTGAELAAAVTQETFIQGGAQECVEGVKYDLRLSQRILKARFGRPVNADKLSETEKSDLRVEPGEVVFVLTEERLVLPMDMLVQLSPKRKLSHAGILTLGGFCVDPGYEGRLLVGLFNLSSSPFPIQPGKKLIGATFFRLLDGEVGKFKAPEEPLDDFPDELVQVMQHYQPVAMAAVLDSVTKLEGELDTLRREIFSRDEWYKQLKSILDEHQKQLDKLILGLEQEAGLREKGEGTLANLATATTSQLASIEKTLDSFKTVMKTVGALISLIAVPVGIAALLKYLGLT